MKPFVELKVFSICFNVFGSFYHVIQAFPFLTYDVIHFLSLAILSFQTLCSLFCIKNSISGTFMQNCRYFFPSNLMYEALRRTCCSMTDNYTKRVFCHLIAFMILLYLTIILTPVAGCY